MLHVSQCMAQMTVRWQGLDNVLDSVKVSFGIIDHAPEQSNDRAYHRLPPAEESYASPGRMVHKCGWCKYQPVTVITDGLRPSE
jgi:hypothetical protein